MTKAEKLTRLKNYPMLSNWKPVTTTTRLRRIIEQTSDLLAKQGNEALSKQFSINAKLVPAYMEKEAINYILFAMCIEVGIL